MCVSVYYILVEEDQSIPPSKLPVFSSHTFSECQVSLPSWLKDKREGGCEIRAGRLTRHLIGWNACNWLAMASAVPVVCSVWRFVNAGLWPVYPMLCIGLVSARAENGIRKQRRRCNRVYRKWLSCGVILRSTDSEKVEWFVRRNINMRHFERASGEGIYAYEGKYYCLIFTP